MKQNQLVLIDLAFELVMMAEYLFGPSTGPTKHGFVSGEIYKRLPKVMKLIITQNEIDLLIEKAVETLKEVMHPKTIKETEETRNKEEIHNEQL